MVSKSFFSAVAVAADRDRLAIRSRPDGRTAAAAPEAAPPVTREQRKADTAAANKAGQLTPAGQGGPGMTVPSGSSMTRAERKAQTQADAKAGKLAGAGDAGTHKPARRRPSRPRPGPNARRRPKPPTRPARSSRAKARSGDVRPGRRGARLEGRLLESSRRPPRYRARTCRDAKPLGPPSDRRLPAGVALGGGPGVVAANRGWTVRGRGGTARDQTCACAKAGEQCQQIPAPCAHLIGAGCPNRTDDLPLTRRVLYQLS